VTESNHICDPSQLLEFAPRNDGGTEGAAHVAAALSLFRNELSGATIALVIPDSGLKYLSADLWESLRPPARAGLRARRPARCAWLLVFAVPVFGTICSVLFLASGSP
jgi:hypothetical protein